MGLSNAISGAIGVSVVFIVVASLPEVSDNFFEIQNANLEISQIEDKVSKSELQFRNNIYAQGGNQFVNFTLRNSGSEKFSDFENFDVIISYDANIAGENKRVTDKLTFVEGGFLGTETISTNRGEFKIQRGGAIIPEDEFDVTITEGVDFDICTGSCFVKQVSTKFSGMGRTSGGGTDQFDDFTTYISDVSGLTSAGDDIQFTRDTDTGSSDSRITWEIWEYIGDIGGPNEMEVLDIDTCTFGTSPGDLTCNGSIIAGGATDDNDVVVFITGLGNPDGGTNDIESCLVTSQWDSVNDRPVFTRGGEGSAGEDACIVSYAVVEWIGVFWNVQRINHEFTDAQVSPTQSETITSVYDISRAFFHTQYEIGPDVDIRFVCHSGTEVELTDPTTLSYRIPYENNDQGWTTDVDMNATTWVISNLETDDLEKMIVNHYNPSPRGTGGSEEDNWQIGITPLRYDTSEAAVTGLSTQTDNCNTSYPRSFISSNLNSESTVEFWQSDTGSANQYTFQITEFPHVDITHVILCNGDSVLDTNRWMVGNVTNDYLDPNIFNPGETIHVCAQVSNPLWPISSIEVFVSTDDGYTTNSTIVIP